MSNRNVRDRKRTERTNAIRKSLRHSSTEVSTDDLYWFLKQHRKHIKSKGRKLPPVRVRNDDLTRLAREIVWARDELEKRAVDDSNARKLLWAFDFDVKTLQEIRFKLWYRPMFGKS